MVGAVQAATPGVPPSRSPVHLVLYRDDTTVTVIGVYASLRDGNAECVSLGKDAGMQLTGEEGEMAPEHEELMAVEPVRWDSVAGVSCWVETHEVQVARS
ncbi:hypothetical protein ED733_003666 [Metarhizium rileyi]|uniref:Uncharacterized protein n=1 Tax=Metarhizium rileyi (strain RCEF 4871) TaxID=1649241 RepID=A0A5C6G3L3_METRR|nr:hypothetical protein ED733_003666 [Metarhizium rileyi]